jgi:hypothetical protein
VAALVDHDPLPWLEARVAVRAAPGVGGGGPPSVADGVEAHVEVEVVGG